MVLAEGFVSYLGLWKEKMGICIVVAGAMIMYRRISVNTRFTFAKDGSGH